MGGTGASRGLGHTGRSHSGIGMADYLVAGTASALGAELLTLNVRHFPMFEDLQPPYRY